MSGYTDIHGQYLSHRITLEGLDEDNFARSLSTARVDMNPHQVEAALFALKSPLARGVLLADEVGLGKTIEASLVIAQRWAERKRRILLIVPASLRKQWQQELSEKFSLSSMILEAKTYRDQVKAGQQRPFAESDGIIITSYEFAARKGDELAAVPWDLVIYDEAHRLRNVYRKNGAKRAKVLRDALKSPFKILLTATPLQNSLMELYGLVSIVDENHFGGEAAFRTMYAGSRSNPASMQILKQRLLPICHRTLRRQVQEAGHINYTARNAVTFDFEPRDDEARLYFQVSEFLKRKDTVSYGDRTNQLVILQVRKILGSSTFAVSRYLEQLISRLEAKKPVDETVTDDIDSIDELAEEFDEEDYSDQEPRIDAARLAAEIKELQGYLDLAKSIGTNAKGEKLIQRLPEAMCKHMGFTYAPSRNPDEYWNHGYSTETDFIFVTTQNLTHQALARIAEDVGPDRSLLLCCKAFNANRDAFENLTIKKIPHAVLKKCEWGRDDYSLNVANLPMAAEDEDDPHPSLPPDDLPLFASGDTGGEA